MLEPVIDYKGTFYVYFNKIFEALGVPSSFNFDYEKNHNGLLSSLLQLLDHTDNSNCNNTRFIKTIWMAAYLLFCCRFDDYQIYWQEWVDFLLRQDPIDEFLLLETWKLHAEILLLMGKKDQLSTLDLNKIPEQALDASGIQPSKEIKIYGLKRFNQRIDLLKESHCSSLDFYASLAELSQFFTSNISNIIDYQDAVCSLFSGKLFQEITTAEQRYTASLMTWEEQCKNKVENLPIENIFSAFEAVCSIYINYCQVRLAPQESNGFDAILFESQCIEIAEFFTILIKRLKQDNELEQCFSFNYQSYNAPEIDPRFIEFLALLIKDAPEIVDRLSHTDFLNLFYWLTYRNSNTFDKRIVDMRQTIIVRRFAGVNSLNDYEDLVSLLYNNAFPYFDYKDTAVEGLSQADFPFNQEAFNHLLKGSCQFENKNFLEAHFYILLSINPNAFINAYEQLRFREKESLAQSYEHALTQYIKGVPLLKYFQKIIPKEITDTINYQRQCALIASLHKNDQMPWVDYFMGLFETLLFDEKYEAAKKIVLVCMIVADLMNTSGATTTVLRSIKKIIQDKNNQPQGLASILMANIFTRSSNQLNDKDFLIEHIDELDQPIVEIKKIYGLTTFKDYVEILGCFKQYYKNRVDEESLPNQKFLHMLFEVAILKIAIPHDILQLAFACGNNLFLQNFLYQTWVEKDQTIPLIALQRWVIELTRTNQGNDLELEFRVLNQFECQVKQAIDHACSVVDLWQWIDECDNGVKGRCLAYYFNSLQGNQEAAKLSEFVAAFFKPNRTSVLESFLNNILAKKIHTLNSAEDVSIDSLNEYAHLAQFIREISIELVSFTQKVAIYSQLEALSKSIVDHLSAKLLNLTEQLELSQDSLEKYAAVYPDRSPPATKHYHHKFKQAYDKAQATADNIEKLELIDAFQRCYLDKQAFEEEIDKQYEILKKNFTQDMSAFAQQINDSSQNISMRIEQLTQLVHQQSMLRKSFETAIGEILGVFPLEPVQTLLNEDQERFLASAKKTGEMLNQALMESKNRLTAAQQNLKALTLPESTLFSDAAAKQLCNDKKQFKKITTECQEIFETFKQQVQLLRADLHATAKTVYDDAANILREQKLCLENLNNQNIQIKHDMQVTTKHLSALTLEVKKLKEAMGTCTQTININIALCDEKQKALIEKRQKIKEFNNQTLTLFNTMKLKDSLVKVEAICDDLITCRDLIKSNLEHTLTYWLATFFQDSFFKKLREWSQKVFDETDKLKNTLQDEIKDITALKQHVSVLTDASSEPGAVAIRTWLIEWRKQKNILGDDQRMGFFKHWLMRRTLNQLESIMVQFWDRCEHMTESQADEDASVNEIEALNEQITLFENQLKETQTNLLGKEQEVGKLETQKPAMEKEASQITAKIEQLAPVVSKLEKASLQFYELLSPTWIEILYNSSLDTDSKLTSLSTLIQEDKVDFFSAILFRQNNAPTQEGNLFYHILAAGADANILTFFIEKISELYPSDHSLLSTMLNDALVEAIKFLVVEQDQEKFLHLTSCVHVLLQHKAKLGILFVQGKEIPLFWYAYQNISDSPAVIKDLLQYYDNDSFEDDQGNTLLHLAVKKGDEWVILALLEKGADLSKPNAEHQTPLNQLINSNYFSLQQKLNYIQMANKASTRCADNILQLSYSQVRDNSGNTLLHQAITARDLELVKHLCQVQSNLLSIKNNDNQLPLNLAVELGNAEIVKYLLEQLALNHLLSDRHGSNGEATQALFFSLLADKKYDAVAIDCLRAFFDFFNWQFNEITNNPKGVLSKLMLNDFLKLKTNACRYLTACTTEEKFNLLLEKGIDPNSYDEERNTPLHDAALKRNLERIKVLLSKGAKIDQQNAQDKTPLMVLYASIETVNNKDREVINYLIDQSMHYSLAGSHLPALGVFQRPIFSQHDHEELYTLHYAARCGDVVAIEKFAERKTFANVTNFLEMRDAKGKTPAHYLVAHLTLNKDKDKIINTLTSLKKGSSLHLRDKQNNLPLHDAVNVDVAVYLIKDYHICKNDPPLTVNDLEPIVKRLFNSGKPKIASIRKLYNALANQMKDDDKALVLAKMEEKVNAANLPVTFDAKQQPATTYSIKSANRLSLTKELKEKIIARESHAVAAILDYAPEMTLPANLNQKDYSHFDLMNDKSQDRRFWVSVVMLKKIKQLPLQDCETGYTLLHALVLKSDQPNFTELSQAGGIEYVIEKDKEGKTVMAHLRSCQLDTQKENLRYLPQAQANDKSIYQWVLESMHLRLKTERDNTIRQTIVAELNFSRIIELEMVLALLKDVNQNQANSGFAPECQLANPIWQFKDCRGKTIAESLLEHLSSPELTVENSSHFQRLLVEFLDVSGIEAGLVKCPQFTQWQKDFGKWLNEFRNTADTYYLFGEDAINYQVHLIFGESISEKYRKNLSSISHLKFNDSARATNASILPFFKEEKISVEKQILDQEIRNAKNAAIYLGSLFEVLGLGEYVTLPTDASPTQLPSLLQATRKKGFSDLYIEIVARLVEKFGGVNPVNIVECNQKAKVNEIESNKQNFVNEVMQFNN